VNNSERNNKRKKKITEQIDRLLNAKLVLAKQILAILNEAGWTMRQPPKNQPHFSKKGVIHYVVVDCRYGKQTIQKEAKVKKYLKLIKKNL